MSTGVIIDTVRTVAPETIKQSKSLREVETRKSDISVDEAAPEKQKVNIENVDFSELVSRVSEFTQNLGTRVSFSYDDRSPVPVIRVFDEESGEMIRQIPREEMLSLIARLRDFSGIIFHEDA